ncbi:hypothetical protein PTKIN_Ptkin06aG0055300 [Pterospermum kingtungense]
MMAQKHLHELLEEDQEPFLLNKYIADRRCQLKKPSRKTDHQVQIKKRKTIISQSSNFPSNFCKNACFLACSNSPDPRKSPLFEFSRSPAKSPCNKSPSAIFLHIPARTAALLLEASLRIQKQSSNSSKTKPHQNKSNGGGLFGSIIKRLTHRNRNRKRDIGNGVATKVSVKDILRWDSTVGKNNLNQRKMEEKISRCEMGFSYSYNGRPSSAVWSESNEQKSLDMDLDTSSSCSQSEDFEEIFMSKDDVLENKQFFESPFHFVLQRSPSFGHRTPLFSSPPTSPSRHQKEDMENYEVESLKKLEVEEEEEQCSPVSVLDPPFEDDDDGHVDDNDDDDDENDGFDLECTYANVQRAKQQLLHKLRRFEKLAELDPVELEKRMLEQDDDSVICDLEEEDEFKHESASLDGDINVDWFLQEVLNSSFQNLRHIPEGMKRLVSDLIAEEETSEQNCYTDREVIAKRVCKRLESWKDVESNTIDMMVEQDFRRDQLDGWKRNQEQIRETALEVEYAIFGLLMEELSEDLASSPSGI